MTSGASAYDTSALPWRRAAYGDRGPPRERSGPCGASLWLNERREQRRSIKSSMSMTPNFRSMEKTDGYSLKEANVIIERRRMLVRGIQLWGRRTDSSN